MTMREYLFDHRLKRNRDALRLFSSLQEGFIAVEFYSIGAKAVSILSSVLDRTDKKGIF